MLRMRILLDTNVLIAAFATRGLCEDVFQIVLAEHQLLISETILEEFKRVLGDKLRVPAGQIEEITSFVREQSEVVSPDAPATWPESDPDDQWVVAAALYGHAELMITGDTDLQRASRGEQLRVVTPRGFWDLLHES